MTMRGIGNTLKLENPALRACLKVQSNEGVLVRRVEPTSDANTVLKEMLKGSQMAKYIDGLVSISFILNTCKAVMEKVIELK
ncbi:hypothetical protein Patl1_01099 [Pistacia atlantica]|uniref:Uncharacterized protein n=1 Tax=Pistacia atlantica TaxID=434234 RepID=A0ACC1CC04_9ROSI|nr:hypothetical protein Patl1_01099 [Pistacia atlantica]